MEATITPVPWRGFDIHHKSRVGSAVREIGAILSDGEWHGWTEITAVAVRFALEQKTVSNLLHGMISQGAVERRGAYYKACGEVHDSREVRLRPVTDTEIVGAGT